MFVSDLRQIGGFSPGTPVSPTNITEILLKVVLNTIALAITPSINSWFYLTLLTSLNALNIYIVHCLFPFLLTSSKPFGLFNRSNTIFHLFYGFILSISLVIQFSCWIFLFWYSLPQLFGNGINKYRFSFSCLWVTIFLHSRELN